MKQRRLLGTLELCLCGKAATSPWTVAVGSGRTLIYEGSKHLPPTCAITLHTPSSHSSKAVSAVPSGFVRLQLAAQTHLGSRVDAQSAHPCNLHLAGLQPVRVVTAAQVTHALCSYCVVINLPLW